MTTARDFRPVFRLLLALGAAGASSCYRPHVVDCVLACDGTGACPSGLSCSAGRCTRGPSCVLQIAAGARHGCALRGGDLQCWGNGGYGQLGNGDTSNRGDGTAVMFSTPAGAVPIPSVSFGSDRQATAVAAGGRHTCAIVGDRATGGATGAAVACWGDDSFGQLGTADGGVRLAPGDASATVPLGGRTPRTLAAGLNHTCALFDDRTVSCWGDNRFGQLGAPGSAGPSTVALGGDAIAVAAGAYHACALLAGGAVRCWGWNDYGQLGDQAQPGGDLAPGLIVEVAFPSGQPAQAIAAGGFHSCAVLNGGAVTCWGQNDAGQIGVARDPSQPAMPPGNLVDLGTGRSASLLAAGTSHTCALLDDFTVKCWGFGGDGELGIGGTANRGDDEPLGDALPRVALGTDPVGALAAGAHHTCAIVAADVLCWGFGDAGRLGVGDTLNRGDDRRPTIAPVLLAGAAP